MKEIKFRAYRKYPNTEMIYFTLEDIIFLRKPVDIIQEFEGIRKTLMQYTGLKDVNGKELYEGDVIKTFYGELKEIRYLKEYGAFKAIHIKYKEGIITDLKKLEFEIIGNIYINPELLEGDK